MALTIRAIPTLTGQAAIDFEKKAREAEKKRGSVDFSEQKKIAKEILAKAKL
nr:hypothetical protein [Parabacteroides goldsteinii]